MSAIAGWVRRWAWLAGVGVAAVVLGWLLYAVPRQADQIDALESALNDEQSNAEANGLEPVAPPPEELIEDPEYTGPQGPAGPEGPPPSDEAVYDAVTAYFIEHPVEDGRTPSAAEIAVAVSSYLTENPPEPGEPGPPPSAEQVAAAVEAYLTANPPAAGEPGEDGEDGAQGPAGPPPSAAEIAAEVESYIEEHPLPMCPPEWPAGVREVLTTDGPIEQLGCFEEDQEEN